MSEPKTYNLQLPKIKKPSVTELLEILNKPALLKWANKLGLEGTSLEKFRAIKLTEGLSYHKQIEDYFERKTPINDIALRGNFERFMADKKVLEYEKKIETPYFQGRLDVMYQYKGEDYLCDFKSNKKRLYLENLLQLTAYRMGVGKVKLGIISIPNVIFMECPIVDFEPYEKILIHLSEIYKYRSMIPQ